MEPFNQDELGLFDDWEPAVWSEVENRVEFHDEMTEKMDNLAGERHEQEEPQEEIPQRTTERVSEVSPTTGNAKSLRELYEYNSTGNLSTRPHATKQKHDHFLEKFPDGPDELQDVGLMNAGSFKGFGGQNSSMGINAPVNSSNLHWEYKNWKPGQGLKESQSKISEAIKNDKDSMHNDFEIVNLP